MSEHRIEAFAQIFSDKPRAFVTDSKGRVRKDTRLAKSIRRANRVKSERPDYDHKAYTRGWIASARPDASTPLDAADRRGEPDEWYDGYLDMAAGREKWHRPLCKHHHNGEGGCGRA